MPVYLDRQHSAFHGTDPELGAAMFGDPRSTVASALARRTRRPGRRWAASSKSCRVAEIMRRLVAEPEWAFRGPITDRKA
jgi:hypothetical protein